MLHVRRYNMYACMHFNVCMCVHACLLACLCLSVCMIIEDSFVGQEYDQCFALITGKWHQGLSTLRQYLWLDRYL